MAMLKATQKVWMALMWYYLVMSLPAQLFYPHLRKGWTEYRSDRIVFHEADDFAPEVPRDVPSILRSDETGNIVAFISPDVTFIKERVATSAIELTGSF